MNLFVLWVESYADALKIANDLALEGGHLLDCSVIGKWSQVMGHFQQPMEPKFAEDLKSTSQLKKAWIPNIKNEIVESYLSLSNQPVQDFILTAETGFIGDVFHCLQQVELSRYSIMDLRLLRFSEPKVILMLTGNSNDADALLVTLENLKSQGIISFKFNLLRTVSAGVKDLFSYTNK